MEKWKEYYTEKQLRDVQKIELELLLELTRVCKENNLEFVIYGGTLLGYEKYKGLIPWDDDIDVALPRDSYAKLLELENKFSPKYLLQTPYNCSKTPYPYTKLRKKGTHFVEYHNRNLKIENGIYIDIYPIDKIPNDDSLRKKQFKMVRKWINIYVCRQSKLYQKKETGFIGWCKNFLRFFECFLPKVFSQKYCIKKIDHFMQLYNDTDNTRYAALNSPNFNNIYTEFYPLIKTKFEGIEVFIPRCYKEHLLLRYGNYQIDLSDDKKIGHMPYIVETND